MEIIKLRLPNLRRIGIWFATFSLLTCLSCQSQPVSLKTKGSAFQELEQNGVTLSVRFMARDELLARHGPQEMNPFISGRYIFYERYLVVFTIDIKNSTDKPLALQTAIINLKFNSRLLNPVDFFNFEDHWRLRDVVEKTNKKNSEQKQRLIREYVFPAAFTLEPQGRKSGYIVFMTSELPEYNHRGHVVLSIPLLGPNTEKAYEFLFYYSFY